MFRAVRAVTVQGGHLVVEDRPDPEPGVGEVLVRVRAAGINGADMLQRRGAYPAPPGSPRDIPGLELAGEVAARGPGVPSNVTAPRTSGPNRPATHRPAAFIRSSRRR